MTYLFVERELKDKVFDSASFIGMRSEKTNFNIKIDQLMNEMLEKKILPHFEIIMNVAYEYSSLLISEGNYSEAFDCYKHIYCKLGRGNYLGEKRDFIKSLNRVELYYNLGIIAKESLKDFDSAMYYFGEAGKEYSRIHGVTIESFFRDEMIDKEGRAFCGLSMNILEKCFGYSYASAFKYKEIFGYEANRTVVSKLLKDFRYPLLLQFIFTINSYSKWLSLPHNFIKGIKITRVLGEMSWLFECYSKDIANEPDMSLFDLIKIIIAYDKQIEKEYKKLNYLKGATNTDKFNSIIKLIELQEKETNFCTKQALCLKLVYFLRNYSAHSLDKNFMTFKDDTFTKKIFLSALMSFFTIYNISQKYIK